MTSLSALESRISVRTRGATDGAGAGDGAAANAAADAAEATLIAKRVVVALPPRVAAASIAFEPALPDYQLAQMRGTQTWAVSFPSKASAKRP